MRNGDTGSLLGVILEVCLNELVGVVTDDLDGVLVSTNCTVAAQTPELAGDSALCRCIGNLLLLEGCACNVINDTDCEVVLGSLLCEVIVNRKDRGRRSILASPP